MDTLRKLGKYSVAGRLERIGDSMYLIGDERTFGWLRRKSADEHLERLLSA